MKRCVACDHLFAGSGWACPLCGYAPKAEAGFPCFAPQLAHENSDYDPRHFPLIAALADKSFWCQTRNRLIVWAMSRFFPKAEQVMEIGVGTGFVMRAIREALPRAKLHGSDIHVAGLQFASARLGDTIDLIQMDARRIPFRDHFDVVCAFDVLEHLREDEAVLDEMRLSLRSRGGIVLTVPQHMFLWGPADEAAFHERRYGTRELAEKVRAAGFDVVLQTSFVSMLLPFLYLSRLRSRRSGKYDLARDLSIPPLLNALLSGISRIEAGLIRVGIAMPAGGSQLLVAVRRNG
jgi:SAM-dependent methyltransferase